ncbi:MAG: TFIIB-type zinc ribbon-containing protein, partial [Nitrososphaerota archaeon]
MRECPECKSADLVERDGEVVCRRCGLVLYTVIDESPEWRAFTLEEEMRKSRTGILEALWVHDKGLTTVIGGVNVDGRGRKIPAHRRIRFLALRKWQRRSSAYRADERNLAKALGEMGLLASKLNLPHHVLNEASAIYRRVLKDKSAIKGRDIGAVAAASIYAACRIAGISKSLKEVARASGLSAKQLGRTYRFIINRLNITVPAEDPAVHVKLIVERLNLPGEVEAEALKILRVFLETRKESYQFPSGNPWGYAAGAVYVAAKKLRVHLPQRAVAAVSGVTEITVRKRF